MTPQEYFDRIKDLRNPDEIKTLCDTLTANLFNETDKPKTRVNKLIPYNKLITVIPHDDVTEGENAYIQTRSDGSYWKRHLYFKFTGIADTNFNGKDGINNKLKFKGQAKKREYDTSEDERTEYRIGVLVPAKSFIQAFERFRAMPESKELTEFLKTESDKGTDPEKINVTIDDRRGNSLRRVVQRNFLSLPKRQKNTERNPKALRAVYVALITERDCPKNINRLLWASRAVGHFVDSSKVSDRDLMHLVTTLGYSDYYIDSPGPFTPEIMITTTEKTTEKMIDTTEVTEII